MVEELLVDHDPVDVAAAALAMVAARPARPKPTARPKPISKAAPRAGERPREDKRRRVA